MKSDRFKDYITRSAVYFCDLKFVQISWVCKKQTAVSHSNTEAESVSIHDDYA